MGLYRGYIMSKPTYTIETFSDNIVRFNFDNGYTVRAHFLCGAVVVTTEHKGSECGHSQRMNADCFADYLHEVSTRKE